MTFIDQFKGKKIVIVGDLVADQFLHGTINRVSREAPVFILRHDNTETRPGGAANAAANIASLGGIPIVIGVTGDDSNGRLLREAMEMAGVSCDLAFEIDQPQTAKLRVLAGQHYAAKQQVIRIDYESSGNYPENVRRKMIDDLRSAGQDAEAIVISDYNYGVVTHELADEAKKIARARNIPLIVDSRYRLSDFAGATSATPNQDEVEQLLGPGFSEKDCIGLLQELELESLLVTRGNEGMLLIEKNKEPLSIDPIGSRVPVDVTGAGDTVIAVYSLALAAGLSFADAAGVANHAGGIVVMKKGTAAVTSAELLISLESRTENLDTAAAF